MTGEGLGKAKRFRVGLSFAGEDRKFVGEVAAVLASLLGSARVLYDRYHEPEFARPDLGLLLPELYRSECELNAVFISKHYEDKEWCGLEWLAIHDMIKAREYEGVMLLRFDDAAVRGLFSNAGYVWIGDRSPRVIADMIRKRLDAAFVAVPAVARMTDRCSIVDDYRTQLVAYLESRRGVLEYVPLRTAVEDDDEFGYSVLLSNGEGAASNTEILPLVAALRRHRALLLTGDPGAGKSTVLRSLALRWTYTFDPELRQGTLPILLDLSLWKKGMSVEEAVHCQWGKRVSSLLTVVDCAFLLDGLNEVPVNAQSDIRIVISKLASSMSSGGLRRLVVTCRSDFTGRDDKGGGGGFRNMTTAVLEPLNRAEVKALAESYLGARSPTFIQSISRSNLWSFVKSPYNLCAMIVVFQANRFSPSDFANGLPWPRFVKALVARENNRGYRGSVGAEELEAGLAPLALEMTYHGQFGTVGQFAEQTKRKLPGLLADVEAFARRCRLVTGAGHELRFFHQLTQEYYAAVALRRDVERLGRYELSRASLRGALRILGRLDGGSSLAPRILGDASEAVLEWSEANLIPDSLWATLADLLVNKLQLIAQHAGGCINVAEFATFRSLLRNVKGMGLDAAVKALGRSAPALYPLECILYLKELCSRSDQVTIAAALPLLHDSRSISLYEWPHDDSTSTRYSVAEEAARTLLAAGEDGPVDKIIDVCWRWKDRSSLVVTNEMYIRYVGSFDTMEREGNLAFLLLLEAVRLRSSLRERLEGWLRMQLDSDETAYRLTGPTHEATIREVGQGEWAAEQLVRLTSQPNPTTR